jgi:acetylornithine/N-succinyldiaminopimelate aminotransferase
VRERGVQLKLGLQRLSAQFGLGEVRGAGLLLALELGSDRALELVQISQQRGLLINAPRPHCLRFMPALNQSVQDIDLGLALLSDALADLH